MDRQVAGAPVRLTEWAGPGGSAAKWPAPRVEDLVAGLGRSPDADLLVGLVPADDAAVVRVAPEVALVSSVDVFPPMVDDPADFGAIVAAHACSNIFAMGARVVLALNVMGLPEDLPQDVASAIAAAAATVVDAAGGVVAGGHTIRSGEPFFGLAVQGLVDPARVLTKTGASPGDVIVISKRLGTGLVLSGGTADDRRRVISAMRGLNRAAAESLVRWGSRVHAVTDVGGFGLAGSAWELSKGSGYAVLLDLAVVPLYRGALAAAGDGVRITGDASNRDYVTTRLTSSADPLREAIAFDPQTSGGLLAAIDPGLATEAIEAGFVVIGEVEGGLPGLTFT